MLPSLIDLVVTNQFFLDVKLIEICLSFVFRTSELYVQVPNNSTHRLDGTASYTRHQLS